MEHIALCPLFVYRNPGMDIKDTLLKLCHDEKGVLKPKNECRAVMINHLILEDGMDINAAEDLADDTLNQSGFWEIPKFEWDEEEEEKNKISTASLLTTFNNHEKK